MEMEVHCSLLPLVTHRLFPPLLLVSLTLCSTGLDVSLPEKEYFPQEAQQRLLYWELSLPSGHSGLLVPQNQ